jgi:methylthioribose-1-phosphate isomerase
MLKTIEWTGSAVRLLDQTKLPHDTVYLDITDERQMHDAIRRLVVRGAPAIGVAAAFGAYLGVRDHVDDPLPKLMARLKEVCDDLATSRPTAVNLFWALDRMGATVKAVRALHTAPRDALAVLLAEAKAIHEEDRAMCRAIGRVGSTLIPNHSGVLTHCNAGGLATAGYGTALAPVYFGLERGRRFHVWADETRPLLQGSRITAYELKENNVPVTLICDNMAAVVLGQGKVDAVIVGADRIAANGDTANKIGTLGVAIAARHFGVPFFVAAPTSTIDLQMPTGRAIPIEQRAAEEVAQFGQRPTAPQGLDVYNPAFDVTPAGLIDAIITEKGVIRPPLDQGIAAVMR